MEHYQLKKQPVILPILAFGGAITAIFLLLLLLPAQASRAAEMGERAISPGEIQTANVITIGVAADLSQAVPDIGWRQVNAVQLAVDQANLAGGISIGGVPHTVALVVADSECNGNAGDAAANALVSADVVAVVGHTCSSSSMTAQSVYSALDIPMVSGSSTNPMLTELGYTNTFRVITRDDTPVIRLATYMKKHLQFDKIAIVEMPSSGVALTDIFLNTFTGLGGTVAVRFNLGSTDDFTSTIQAIVPLAVDAIFFSSLDAAEAGQFSLQVDQEGLTTTPVAWFANSHELDLLDTYLGVAGAAAEGDLAMLHPRDKEMMPGYGGFNNDYVAAGFPNYGDEALEWGAYAYDAAQLILAAISAAQSTAPLDIRNALAATPHEWRIAEEYHGFDDKGDILPQMIWFGGVRGEEWVQLTPVGLATDGPTLYDNGFNQFTYAGVQRADSENFTISTVYTSTDGDQYQPNLELCASDGNELCLGVGFMMGDPAKLAAEAHPDVNYAVMDADGSDLPDNLRFYDFNEKQAGYLAGTLAGLMTESDVVSAVGGIPVPAVVDLVESYGIAAVCANPSATAILGYTDSFVDPAQGALVAAQQMLQGSDVVFGAGGPTGNGAILFATQNNAWGIGVDTDQYLTLFDSGAVSGADMLLSSAMKMLDNAAFDAIWDTLAHLFTPGIEPFGLTTDGVGLAPFHETDTAVSASVKNWLDVVKQKLIQGEITPEGACLTPQTLYLPAIRK